MNILFLSDRNPCPPINGLYVPIFELVKRLRCMPGVNLDLALPDNCVDYRKHQLPSEKYFQHVYYFPLKKRSIIKKTFDLILLRRPPYSLRMVIPEKFLKYDVIFAQPDGMAETLYYAKKTVPSTITILWLNELYITVTLGKLYNSLPFTLKKIPYLFVTIIKHIMVYFHEKRYLSRLDAIVFQTQKEASRVEVFKKDAWKPYSFICTNPMKHELLREVVRDKADIILIHAPRDPDEINNFVRQISHYNHQNNSSIFIRICVRDVTVYAGLFENYYNVQIIPYQENIANVYHGVFCSVVFTRQRFGVVNRVKEGMTAGIAVIGFPEALRTVGDVIDFNNVIYTSTEQDFVSKAITMINKPELAESVGVNARNFILENEKQGPDQFINDLLSYMDAITKSRAC